MSEPSTYLDMAMRGEVMSDEIDDFVSAWHKSNSDQDLHDYLGMTFEEYSLWVSHPDFIDLVIAARKNKLALRDAVNDNLNATQRLAARTDDPRKLAELKRWIAANPNR
jgi:hypothetical protein